MQTTKQCRATFQNLMDHDYSPLSSTKCNRLGHSGKRLLNKTVEQMGLGRNRPVPDELTVDKFISSAMADMLAR